MAKSIKSQEHPLIKQARWRLREAIQESNYLCSVAVKLHVELIDPPACPEARRELEDMSRKALREFEQYQPKIHQAAQAFQAVTQTHGSSSFGSPLDVEV